MIKENVNINRLLQRSSEKAIELNNLLEDAVRNYDINKKTHEEVIDNTKEYTFQDNTSWGDRIHIDWPEWYSRDMDNSSDDGGW